MPITINGAGSLTGITAGGLPDEIVTPADLTQPLTLRTVVASTSGTSIDFTGIPSWVKRITVMLVGVSTSGASGVQVQVGSGSFNTSGYVSSASAINGGYGQGGSTTGLVISYNTVVAAANSISGLVSIALLANNQWVFSGNVQYNTNPGAMLMSGGNTPALSGSLDRLRIVTGNGTDTFDAGFINIMYE